MAVRRTIANLMALFASNQPAKSITPDRVRDLIMTVQGTWAALNKTGGAQVTALTLNEWAKINVTTELAPNSAGFSMPQSNRITCGCSIPAVVSVTANIGFEDGANTAFQAAIALNGDIIPSSIRTVRLGSGGDKQEAVLFTDYVSGAGDYVEVWVRNITNNNDLTVSQYYLSVSGRII